MGVSNAKMPIELVRLSERVAGVSSVVFCLGYASGLSARALASQLNADGIPSPGAGHGHWSFSTISGNEKRGTVILNSELYIGRLIWNRQRFVKDPASGKRISRLNPEADWVLTDVPELRILDQDLWQVVRARQGAMKTKNTDTPVWDRRRPKTLFFWLMTCGGGFAKVSQTQFGCSTARSKGKAVCSNMSTIGQAVLERRVLDALHHNLMDQEALSVFCEEYARERNRLQAEATQNRGSLEKELYPAEGASSMGQEPSP